MMTFPNVKLPGEGLNRSEVTLKEGNNIKCDLVLHLTVIFYLALIAEAYSQYSCDVLLPEANVYCISPTEFTLGPPDCDQPVYSCPGEYLCSDSKMVCTLEGPAACKLSRACQSCPPNALGTCVNNRQYAACVNGTLDTKTMYCQASRPYCSMEHTSYGNITTVCTNKIKDIACNRQCPTPPPTPTPSPTPPVPPVEKCCDQGQFKISVDVTGKGLECGSDDCNGSKKDFNLDVSVSFRKKNDNSKN